MLVLVALMLLHQNAGFNAPAVPGTQVAALMHGTLVQGLR